MLVFKVAALLLVLLGPAIAQLTIDPNVIFDPVNPVCVTLDLDNYTRVLVREETSVKINCSFVRSSFINQNSITDETRVSIRWVLARQLANLVDFMRPATSLPTDQAITIRGQNNEILNNTGVRLPTLAVDGTTGEYTCEVCSDRGTPTEACTNSTVPIVGRRFPPVIDEGDPNGSCTVVSFFEIIVTCFVGMDYCIPPTAPNQIILQCQHSLPPTPVTPNPQIGVWFLDGVQISNNQGGSNDQTPPTITLTEQGRRLAIPNPAMAPLGNYTCMLTNIAGFDVSTTILSICVPPVLRPPRRDDPSTIQIGLSPHCLTTPQTTILCELQSGSPVITYSWTRNSATISGETSDRLTVTETGNYQCTATNVVNSASAMTTVAVGAIVAFNGGITGRTDNGCGRLTSPSARNPDICVLVGETLAFTCVRDGGNPESTPPQITNPGSVVVTGPVTNVQPSSDGIFNCSSRTNQCGTTSMTIDVQVFDPPVIDLTIALPILPNTMTGGAGRMDITTISGSTVRLFCPSTGRPPATITWQRRVGGNLVAVDPAFVTATMVGVLPAALLTLTNVQGADFTEYVCTATNVVGTDTQNVTLLPAGSPPVIDEAPTPAPGPPTEPGPENNIRIGAKACIPPNGNVRIRCNTLSGSEPLTYEWRRNGGLIANPNPPTSLLVTEAGTYRCRVSNTFNFDQATSEIQVTPEPGSVTLQITSNAPIDCSLLNPPPANIDRCPRFARVDFRCTSSQGLPTQITFNGASFTQNFIDPFETANDGLYSCSAATSCGTEFSNLTVQAFEPAQVDVTVPLPPPDTSGSIPGAAGRDPVDVPVGGNVTLFCPTTGVDLPRTRWEINGVEVMSMPPRIVVDSRTVNGQIFLTLTITNISASDQITYTCVTMNAAGTDSRTVIVREPPRNEWCIDPWSTCTPDCHRGTRNRTVVCKDNARRVLSDLSCSPPKPAQTGTCDTRGPCFLSPVWRPQEWTQCTRQCGTGSRTRRVDCIIPRTNTVVDNGQCVHIARPKSYELCNTLDCCSDRYNLLCGSIAGSSFCNMEIFKQVCCWTCGGT